MFCTLQAKQRRNEAFLVMIIPALDMFSDMLFIFTTVFYSTSLFVCSVLFIVIQNVTFLYRLHKTNMLLPTDAVVRFPGYDYISPSLIWLGCIDNYPSLGDKKVTLSLSKLDSLPKFTLYFILWIGMILLQILYIVALVLWIAMTPLLVLLWLSLGTFLFQTKVMSISVLWNTWCAIWLERDAYKNNVKLIDSIDTSILNESILSHILLQALPQICVQATNSYLTNSLTPVTIFSITLSSINVLSGIYKYGYYVLWLGKSIAEVPTSSNFINFTNYSSGGTINPIHESAVTVVELQRVSRISELDRQESIVITC